MPAGRAVQVFCPLLVVPLSLAVTVVIPLSAIIVSIAVCTVWVSASRAPSSPFPANLVTSGTVMAASATMMPITTSSSIRVDP